LADFVTKDSGARSEYKSGMVRDTQDGKPRFNLLYPLDVPYSEQMLTRLAELLERGMAKYGWRNWEKANSDEELIRFRESAHRHFIQWLCGEKDEDHGAATMFNIIAAEYVTYKKRIADEL
jgi:dATP/dGTP diphosphohydrolase, N-terminal